MRPWARDRERERKTEKARVTAGRVTGVLEGANIDEAEGKRESAPEREKRERRDEREIGRDRKRGR